MQTTNSCDISLFDTSSFLRQFEHKLAVVLLPCGSIDRAHCRVNRSPLFINRAVLEMALLPMLTLTASTATSAFQ